MALAFAALAALEACTPSIGDKCVLSTDCSIRGDRLCDSSQPGGYCTVFNCTGNACPDTSACILFRPGVPGCSYDDRTGGQRSARSFCMAQCKQDSDCRTEDGYVCADPRTAPWNAIILDDNQRERVCIQAATPDAGISFVPEAGVCGPSGPIIDGGFPDAAADAPSDAPADVTDAGIADAADSGG